MSVAFEERAQRQARARAVAATLLDTPELPRRFVRGGDRLVGSRRRRRSAPVDPALAASPVAPPRRRGRRLLIGAVLAAQVVVLGVLLLHPAFHVAAVEVTGRRLLTAAAVEDAAGVHPGGSIFLVDGEGARRALLADPWVQSATVETGLPASVRITVVERTPVLRVARADGDLLVAAGGAMLPLARADPASVPRLPILEDQRPPAAGGPPSIPAPLLSVLADTAARFPVAFGVEVASFRWRADGVLTIVTAARWTAVIGHVDEADRVAEIPAKLAALAALRARLDLAKPTFGYVDLENPTAPAVGGTPGTPPPLPGGMAPPAQPAVPAPIVVGGAATAPAAPVPTASAAGAPPAAQPAAGAGAAPGAAPGPSASPSAPATPAPPTPVMVP